MTQYESEARIPKQELVKEMAGIFDVSTHALSVSDIDTYISLMHTLFTLEDMYGLKIGEIDGEIYRRLDKSDYYTYNSILKMFQAWQQHAAKSLPHLNKFVLKTHKYWTFLHLHIPGQTHLSSF